MNRILLRITLAVAPIVISLLVTTVIILVVGASPGEVFENVIDGAIGSNRSISGVVNYWIPLVLCSMGLIVTFTAGLWNIGVEGQMTFGAIAASLLALTFGDTLPNEILLPLEIVAAMIGGGAWAALAGFLKVRLGVHEIFGGVGLNALANVFAIYLIAGPWQPPEGGSLQATAPFAPAALFPRFSTEFPVSLLALIVVGIVIIVITLVLRGTRWGLHLKATGKNARSALLLGVPTMRSAMTAFIVCGALAGIAGSYRALLTYGSLRPFVSGGIGFLALLVVLVSGVRAIWTPLIALVFAGMSVGSITKLPIALRLDQSLSGVLQGLVVLFVLLGDGVRQRFFNKEERTG